MEDDRVAVLERENAALRQQLAQMAEQLAQKDERLAAQAAQLAEQAAHRELSAGQDATIAQQALRIADLEVSTPPAPPRMIRSMTQEERTKLALKLEQDRTFENSLEPLLRTWMGEAPTTASAVLRADRAALLKLEARGAAGDASIAALVPEVTARLRETAEVTARLRTTAAPSYAAAEQLQRLRGIVDAGNELFFGMYDTILTKQVRNNDGYDGFCADLGAISPDRSRFPQPTGGLAAIYSAAREAHPLFGGVLEQLSQRASADEGVTGGIVTRATPLKHVFRVLQKHATRVDGGKPTEFETACDIVRGSIVCESMGDLLAVLRVLLTMVEEGAVVIVRTKNRFTCPTAAGWADAMLNFVCIGGGAVAAGHVCELQLVHATMLKARKEFGGHAAYTAFREAAELLEFVVGEACVAEAEPAVAALEAAQAAVEAAAGDAVAKEAWLAVAPAAAAALAVLRQARALVPGGGDAAAAADALLQRGARAGPPGLFVEAGGDPGEITKGGATYCSNPSNSWDSWSHAATAGLTGRCSLGVVSAGHGFVGLATSTKDLSKPRDIRNDKDVWLMGCGTGRLYTGGGRYGERHGEVPPGSILTVVFDAAAQTVHFLKDGKPHGPALHDVVADAKLVVSVGLKAIFTLR